MTGDEIVKLSRAERLVLAMRLVLEHLDGWEPDREDVPLLDVEGHHQLCRTLERVIEDIGMGMENLARLHGVDEGLVWLRATGDES